MSKLYVFAIGGTGSRVLKSLTMLLAAGVRANTEKIIPMIIDTDINNGDLELCRNIVKKYRSINRSIYSNIDNNLYPTDFFRTEIEVPKELNINGLNYGSLDTMIGYINLKEKGFKSTKDLFDTLFNEQTSKMDLEIGFKGSPNVGCIVLKNIVETDGFRRFTQNFAQGDRIFIIGSIFGGTGAAGFPLLLNLFRDPQSGINNAGFISNSIIGGISILPYFVVDDEKFNKKESAINSNTFITKTKAALAYYNKYIVNNINALFFAGDSTVSRYENFDGGIYQQNPSSFIEFISALSILEFLDYEINATTQDALSSRIKYFEFGISNDDTIINLNHLGTVNDELIQSLIKFQLFSFYYTNYIEDALKKTELTWKNTLNVPGNFEHGDLVKNIKSFCEKYYYRWLYELGDAQHQRTFVPFLMSIKNETDVRLRKDEPVRLNVTKQMLLSFVNGISTIGKKNFFGRKNDKDRIDFDEVFDTIVNDIVQDKKLQSFNLRFSRLLVDGISKIYVKRFNNK